MKRSKKKPKTLVPLSLAIGLAIGLALGAIMLFLNYQEKSAIDKSVSKSEIEPEGNSLNSPKIAESIKTVKLENNQLSQEGSSVLQENSALAKMSAKASEELDHTVCKKLGYCIHKIKDEGLEKESSFKKEMVTSISDIIVLKSKIKPLYEEGKLKEVLSYLDSYTGEEQSKIKELRKVLELQIFAKDKIAESRGPLKPLSKNPRKELVTDYEAIAREEQRRKTIERELRVHNDIVDIGMDKLIVFNSRGSVIKYSRLIKACENRTSKFFEERKQRALQFLAENKDDINIIPHNKQKVKIRQGGGQICQVYYGTSMVDEYGYTNSRRNIGYILTYDLKPLPPKIVGGC